MLHTFRDRRRYIVPASVRGVAGGYLRDVRTQADAEAYAENIAKEF
jgi:hypothetical protein